MELNFEDVIIYTISVEQIICGHLQQDNPRRGYPPNLWSTSDPDHQTMTPQKLRRAYVLATSTHPTKDAW